RADRLQALDRPERRVVLAAVGRLPHAARGRRYEDLVLHLRVRDDIGDATPDVRRPDEVPAGRGEARPPPAGLGLDRVLLRADRGELRRRGADSVQAAELTQRADVGGALRLLVIPRPLEGGRRRTGNMPAV